jgi:hypothetical protein
VARVDRRLGMQRGGGKEEPVEAAATGAKVIHGEREKEKNAIMSTL